jgi:hypothetical protein
MATPRGTADRVLEAIDHHLETLASRKGEKTGGTVLPREILKLAEAYAWLTNPNQAHGGGSADVQ